MKELIKITEQNGKRAVSARELHNYLETPTRFYEWINRMLEYGFVQSTDYQCLHKNVKMPNGGTKQALDDYVLTIDTAKEIAMIQRTPKGKQARQYFIEMERIAMDKLLREQDNRGLLIGSVEHETSIIAKKAELMNVIKYYLRWGDLKQIAKELNLSYDYIRNVSSVSEGRKSKQVVNAMYQKALENKQGLLFSYQEMIDELKR
ncbi:antA/AntB antirepressor family protein [Empedobacter brevis]|uniref:antA/AntB antirepressor family protein n=1 Tax=Empedobacter brevis TaxID=247 RepID=UPI0039B01667